MKLKIYQVDAFTEKLFGGNPAAVVPLKKWLPDSLMQNIAAENNLAETAYFIPTGGTSDFHLRWFTPSIEVRLCGHATLATAHTLWQHLKFEKDTIAFDSKSGILRVSRKGDTYELDFPLDTLNLLRGDTNVAKTLENALNIKPLEVFKGKDDYMVVVSKQSDIEKLNPDFRLLKTIDTRGIIVTAKGENVDFVSRSFFPAAGIDEDPVTGSAHTTMTPYWAGKLGKKTLTAQQISARKGDLVCTLAGDRVLISGKAVTYLVGNINI
jgi:PhzF family phenazine biosynthesis protein